MPTPQENITIVTKHSGHTVVLKPFITGYDKVEMNSVLHDLPEGTTNAQKIKLLNKKNIDVVVVSVDGVTENTGDQVLNMDARDYQEVVAAINEITGEKKSETNTSKTSPTTSAEASPAAS